LDYTYNIVTLTSKTPHKVLQKNFKKNHYEKQGKRMILSIQPYLKLKIIYVVA